MASERVERRLAAILAADVAGYSRLTSMAEEDTHVRLKEHLRGLVDPKITEYRGRVVKNTGDGLLAEFSSVVDAVRSAIEMQRGMAGRNANIPEEKRIEFRIGLNLGDVIIDSGDIFGNCVNVAVRLEAIADPGGICVSGRVQEYAQDQLEVSFEDAGEHQLKNIARPVRAYHVRFDRRAKITSPVTVPSKPSMAVLPFQSLGDDPEQEYFADGVVEEIITAQKAVADAEDRLARLYRLVEEGLTDLDDVLKARLTALKGGRDRANAALERARERSSSQIQIDPALIERFGRLMRENFSVGSVPFRKAYLHSLIDCIEVDDAQIRIKGSKDVLEKAALATQNGQA
jgi:class 3 adenylate cyclase